MYRIKILLGLAVILSVTSASIASNTIYVDVNGPNDPGSGTYNDPFRRIQAGINAAANDDVIQIRPGLYTGNGNYNLDPNGKSITIRSIDPNNPANTIIDPNGEGRGFYFHRGEDANCVIWGLTITNGVADSTTGYNGGNIYCYISSPTIRNCIMRNGYAEGSGGGLCCDYSYVTVINSTIKDNTAGGDYGYGGGISCQFLGSPTIIGCTINGNTATMTGGGIFSGGSEPNILNCIIIDNNAAAGGGINCYYSGTSHVVNCTIAGNRADYSGGAVFCWSGGGAIIENSILWANSASEGMQLGLQDEGQASVTYCDVQGGQTGVYDPCENLVWGQGNTDSEPCFASFDPEADPELWDFHLQSSYGRWNQNSHIWATDSNTSLCIDAGDPNSDWSGEPWPNGKRINMGAYGGTSQASKNGNPADFDIDNLVDFADFAKMANKWLAEQVCIEDLNNDGKVNFADISIFAENWLWTKK
ncbi:MAG: hypothetical protein WCE45_05065 [Sedimentisphaerales bacterium]